jgi:3-hydroxyacyl-CoA dehydrogenase/enoyl-CoA hydratase/3-hydroxybutyryl-CoA epimerase
MAYFQTENLWVNQLADGVADLVLDVPGGKVNALNRAALVDIDQALDRVADDAGFRLLLLRTAKKASFASGLAPRALANMTPAEFGEVAVLGQKLCAKLAGLRLPTVAIVSGGCLGGGLELALSCDYRVAVDKPTTIFGFPGLELGLIPVWGGTQRLPRLVGLNRGLQMLLGGKRLLAHEARAWGLVDDINNEAKPSPPAFLNDPQKRSLRYLPLRTLRQKMTESTRLGRWLIFRKAERLLRSRLPDDMPAPRRALDAVRTGLRRGAEVGMAREREAARELFQTEACRHLVRLHSERDKFRTAFAGVKEGQEKVVGVIGGHSRAAALIQMAITKGYQVVLRESDDAALGSTLLGMLTTFQQEVARGAMSQAELVKCLAAIRGTTDWKGFEEADLVLEAIGEDSADRKALFRELEQRTAAKTVLVTTSPAVSLAALQDGLSHPERVAGLSFSAPVGRSLLVEVAAGDKARVDIRQRLSHFVTALGRVPWPVSDLPGLLIERLLMPYLNEAILLVREGVEPRRVDQAMVRFGMMDGPLTYLDLLGLDVAAALAKVLASVLGPRLVLDDAFATMVQQNWLGHRSGVGFYRYRKNKSTVNDELVAQLRGKYRGEAVANGSGTAKLAYIRQRLVLLMVNEAAWCLVEGRADGPAALDLAMTLVGWAPHRGGPLQYARNLGLDAVTTGLEDLAVRGGPRFQPCPALRGFLT